MLVLIIILSVLLIFFGFFCFKFALDLIKVEDAVEKSLDVIEDKYKKLNKILDIPVFYDTPEIKSVLREIEDTRDSLLYIANIISNNKAIEEVDDKED